MANPFLSFPPDDCAYMRFLILLADSAQLHVNPTETWRKVCKGIRALIFRYGLPPAMVFGPMSRSISAWVSPSAIGAAVHSKKDSSAAGLYVDGTSSEQVWLPSEIFLHDEELATYLFRNIGVAEDIITDEINYWVRPDSFIDCLEYLCTNIYLCLCGLILFILQILIKSKIHIPPKKHTPSLPFEEKVMADCLSRLRHPVRESPLRRLLTQHASRIFVSRLAKLVDHALLRRFVP